MTRLGIVKFIIVAFWPYVVAPIVRCQSQVSQRPGDVLTREAFMNGLAVLVALGGSTNTITGSMVSKSLALSMPRYAPSAIAKIARGRQNLGIGGSGRKCRRG